MDDKDEAVSPEKKGGRGLGIFLLVGTSVALFGGFVVAKKPEEQIVSPEYEPPTKFALRALKWATLLTLSGAGLIGGAVCWYLDVRNIPEFSVRMNQIISPIFKSIDRNFPKTVLNHQYGVLNPNKPGFEEMESSGNETSKD
ncbi:hypothetical protein LOD99_2676 [Oopsacas minuta]|uniref:Transmembrane protein 242 n=1 Tax=Oopsacas minuta TaxID=111878 RepID=A0AAV7K0T0_9METZ|nr:hypothetical protein LOD99_2676 [Oopsacas minuta]